MNAEMGVAFLNALGAKRIRAKENGWIEACCPLAPWTHAKKVDNNPSFGLSVNPVGRSHYSCFVCQSGSAEELVQVLEMYTDGQHKQYNFVLCHALLEQAPEVLSLPDYGEFKQPVLEFTEWPKYWLDSFKTIDWFSTATEYLHTRGVDMYTAGKFDLRYDTQKKMIVCPYWDVFGRLAGARGRSIQDSVQGSGKHFDYSWERKNNSRLVWYNETVLNQSGPVVVVEGQFDCWKTARAYPKVVANLTARPSWEKMKKLGDCPFVIQIPDNDEAGKGSIPQYVKYCHQLGIGYKVLHLGEDVKDPAECSVEYLKERIDELVA